MPLFYTAEDSPETVYLQDNFVLLFVANLPTRSKHFAGPVLAAYLIFFTVYGSLQNSTIGILNTDTSI